MFSMPDAVALLAVTLPIAAAILRYAPRRATGDDERSVAATDFSAVRELSGRVRAIEIVNEGFRAECRGEFKVIKQMIQFLPSGEPRRGGIGFGDEEFGHHA
jgi:hypothetical protein